MSALLSTMSCVTNKSKSIIEKKIGTLNLINYHINLLYLAKCEFARATVTYLSHQVDQGKVCHINAKVEAIEKYPSPAIKRNS